MTSSTVRARILAVAAALVFAAVLATSASVAGERTEGTVVETMDAGGYTYVLLRTDSGDVWAAGPRTAVAVGSRAAFGAHATMTDFHSESLDRTFTSIEFASAIEVLPGSGASAPGAVPSDPHGTVGAAVATPVAPVAKAAGGVTVAELYAGKGELAGKEVIVRGRVVKYNSNIMGRNWLHIQDGTGASGANDLTVTTEGSAKVGDVVVIRGVAVTDKDFGMGYRYDLMLEDAAITVE